jgi:hypothetical protein
MSSVLGIDFSTFAIWLAKVDENTQTADWTRVALTGQTAWERTRQLRDQMPRGWFYDDIYLAAIEQPFGGSTRAVSALMRTQGAILVSIPTRVECWQVAPYDWKRPLGLRQAEKPTAETFAAAGFELAGDWPQDSLDALGVAVYARDLNAAGIAKQLKEKVV